MKVNTKAIHFDADQKLVDFIEKRLEKLEVFYDKIIEADVTLKLENSGKVKGKIAEIKLNIPGNIIIAKETSKSFEESVDKVSEALRRQIIRHKEKIRE